jgi:hypothetical protein
MIINLTTVYSYLEVDGNDLKLMLIDWLMNTVIYMMIVINPRI